ncbi:MAG: LysE family transporter [Deltaproteobacteria bacterium]|nr:LysE family transporter [Deltaproteobacteria bacterium]
MIVEAAALGLGLGVVTGMPLGVVNVAIVDAALAGRTRFATGVGIGGALADTAHAILGFIGVGALLTARPDLVRWLALGAAALILTYVVVTWRGREQHRVTVDDSSFTRGALTGVALTLPNPGALAAWVAVAAVLWPDATTAEACALGTGVGVGSAGWFALLARWISRVRPDHPAIAIVTRSALVVLVGIAGLGVARAL